MINLQAKQGRYGVNGYEYLYEERASPEEFDVNRNCAFGRFSAVEVSDG